LTPDDDAGATPSDAGATEAGPPGIPSDVPETPKAAASGSDEGRIARQAGAFLAGRLEVDASQVIVNSVEGLEWPSGALGCPQPGQMYIQVITPGYRVVLSVGGDTYEVHTDARLEPAMVLCTSNPSR
jgi:hypothetical protein